MHRILENALREGRTGVSYLIQGDSEARVTREADDYLRRLFCESHTGCGKCPGCVKFDMGSHVDLFKVTGYKVDEVRPLPAFAALHPFEGGAKAVYIPRVDLLNEQAQNMLLKTIEEPLEDTVVVLGACNRQAVLPTIVSRCVQIMAGADGKDAAARLKKATGLSEGEAIVLVEMAGGDFGGAMELATQRFLDVRNDAAQAVHRLLFARNKATSKIEKLLWRSDGQQLGTSARAALCCLADILRLKYEGFDAPILNEDIRGILAEDTAASPRRLTACVDGLHTLLERMDLCAGLNKSLALQGALLGILEETV